MPLATSQDTPRWAFLVHIDLSWDVRLVSYLTRPRITDRVVYCLSEEAALRLAETYVTAPAPARHRYWETGRYIERLALLEAS